MATAKQIAARKRFAEMAKSGKLAQLRKKAAKKNPAATVSQEISAQMRKGKPQKQAVAIALEMERQGKLKKNPARNARKYYSLLSRSNLEDGWVIEFGDYDKEAVMFEMVELKRANRDLGLPFVEMKIISTPANQKALIDAVEKLNQASDAQIKRNPTPGKQTRSRTKLVADNGRKKNPLQAYAIKCSRSGRTLGYADSLPMAKTMATAIANDRMIPVQIVKA